MNIQTSGTPAAKLACDLLIVGATTDLAGSLAALDSAFAGQLLPYCETRRFKGKPGSLLLLPSMGRTEAPQVLLVGLGDGAPLEVAQAVGRAVREARTLHVRTLGLDLGGRGDTGAIVEHVALGNYVYDPYKPETERTPALESLVLLGAKASDAEIKAASVRAKWQGFARDLVNMPPADLYPATLAEHAQKLANLPHVTVEVWDATKCAEEGLVGIIAVGQGSAKPPCMIHVSYAPPAAKRHIGLVGKGVTFDSGGLSLKPSDAMQTMRCDMGGAATMLAATGALAELGASVAVDCFLGAAENMNDGNSFKLSDILRYRNGVTVEIHNTDAEGRLVLADCLILASETKGITHILDAATLTGACVVAIGSDFTGLFTGDDTLAAGLHAAAAAEGEGLWRLPLHQPYNERLKGEWGQIKNIGGREAGATTAALFLQHFVRDNVSWAHLDIAGSAYYDKASAGFVSGGTGQMVRSLVTWAISL